LKIRLLGAAVLFALAAIFLPMIFSAKSPTPGADQALSLAIPPSPDHDLQTRTMSLTPDAAVGAATDAAGASSAAQGNTAVIPGAGDRLATVNIGSRRPHDVETDPAAGSKPVPTTVTTGSGASPTQPVIPMQDEASGAHGAKPAAAMVHAKAPTGAPSAAAIPPAAAGRGSYLLNLSAYASATGAASLERRVRALGYPVSSRPIQQAGKARTLVLAGPFETRTAAEAARLKITQSIPGAPARLEQDASADNAASATATAIARPASAAVARAGGWAVQLAAMSGQNDANALRDKLRANGFDGFVDSVQAGGKQLWRVRAGPQTQRADAQRVHDQIKAKLGIDGNVVSVP
jgi:DedD protein